MHVLRAFLRGQGMHQATKFSRSYSLVSNKDYGFAVAQNVDYSVIEYPFAFALDQTLQELRKQLSRSRQGQGVDPGLPHCYPRVAALVATGADCF